MVAREGGVGIVDAAAGHCVVVLLLWYVWFQWVAAWSGLDFCVYFVPWRVCVDGESERCMGGRFIRGDLEAVEHFHVGLRSGAGEYRCRQA
jgi:hypothetical protein